MTIGSRRVRLEFFSLSTRRVVNHSRFFADHTHSWADYCDRFGVILVPPDPELIIKIRSRATRLGLSCYEYLDLLVKADLDRLGKE
jgi:hypothetical protein